jgi:hypothetical protein
MNRGVQAAIRIASLPQSQFDARMRSGEFSKQQVRDAYLLRGELMSKRRHVGSPHLESVRKHMEEKPMLRTIEKKIADAVRTQQILKTAIGEINKANTCWYTNNADKVLLSSDVAEMVALDKRENELRKASKLPQSGFYPSDTTRLNPPEHATYEPGTDKRPARILPGEPAVDLESASDVLERLTRSHMKANPHLTKAQATTEMSLHPEFSAVHRRERVQKFGN